MSDCSRNVEEVRNLLQACSGFSSQQTVSFYDSWAECYEQDLETMTYRSPHHATGFLEAHLPAGRDQVQVLDVACGSGLVAKLMFEQGFRHFVGVDGSEVMLQKAAESGLYQDLRLALLGTEPLPAQTGVFDVVMVAGALDAGFVPVSVVRELCSAAKPGGLVCMSRGNHRQCSSEEYRKDLERELVLLEEEGLWSPVGVHQVDQYMENTVKNQQEEGRFISGTVYLYQRSQNV
ncbi:methyltransferase-like protein 27 [Centropristis striata]|uniref:methyltransferase-like protein 27 n=1 Tax=Centropristis striata TaxID=184440 RepID=UPI0027DED83B|nr:methyltransferase-like protein 27 [Centropristis striata]